MRWQVFLIFAFVFIVLDTSFVGVMTIPTLASIAPSVTAVLVVFICLFASKLSALAGCLLLGLVLDLNMPYAADGGQKLHLIGPNALGFVFAGYVIVQMRTMVFRQRALTLGVMTVLCVLAAAVVALTIFVIRSWYGEGVLYYIRGSAMRELVRYTGIALYSGLLAIPLGWIMLQTMPIWGFYAGHQRRVMR